MNKINKIIIHRLYPEYCHYYHHDDMIYRPFLPQLFIYTSTYNYYEYCLCQSLYNSKSTKDDKNIYYIFVESNTFVSEEDKTKMFEVYRNIKSKKKALEKFIYICKLKFSYSQNDFNMYMEFFSENSLEIIEHGCKYTYDLIELKKITTTPFNYSELDIPILLKIRNPYTNKPFSVHNVYNIYFHLMKHCMLPITFHLYFQNNMNAFFLKTCYGSHIFIECVKRKYTQLSYTQRIRIILKMIKLYEFESLCKMPTNILYKKFSENLIYFFIYYNLLMNNFENTSLLHYYKDLFIDELVEFHDKNQSYGREIYRKDITGKYVKFTNNTIVY